MKCPKCEGELILRKGRFGQFYGCVNFPKCKYTQKCIGVIEKYVENEKAKSMKSIIIRQVSNFKSEQEAKAFIETINKSVFSISLEKREPEWYQVKLVRKNESGKSQSNLHSCSPSP